LCSSYVPFTRCLTRVGTALQPSKEEDDMLVKGLQEVLKDMSFDIKTPVAIQTRGVCSEFIRSVLEGC